MYICIISDWEPCVRGLTGKWLQMLARATFVSFVSMQLSIEPRLNKSLGKEDLSLRTMV